MRKYVRNNSYLNINPYSVTFIFKISLQLEENCTVKKLNGIQGIKDDISKALDV